MNIANLLRRSASDNPDKVALRLDDIEVTYAGYAEHGGRMSRVLPGGRGGARRADRVLPAELPGVPAGAARRLAGRRVGVR